MSTLGLRDLAFLGGLGGGGGGATDPNTLLLISGRGANGSTAIVDSSMYERAITSVSGVSIDTSIQDPFGANEGVLRFAAAAYGFNFPATVFNAAGPCSCEFFLRWPGGENIGLMLVNSPSVSNSLEVFVFGSALHYRAYPTGGGSITRAASGQAANTWRHYLFGFDQSGVHSLFAGGQLVSSFSAAVASATACRVGNYFGTNNVYHLAQFRWRSVAPPTANFTPPAAPFTP